MRDVRIVTFPAVTIGYEIDGPPDGVPVFLLHGFPDTTSTWDAVVRCFPRGEYRLIRPHMRGHGRTVVNSGYPVSAETAALGGDVAALADHLGIRSFHLVGSDWGCRAAYALAGSRPDRVRSLVTLGTGYNEATPVTDLSLGQVTAFWYQWLFQTSHGHTLLREQTVELCRHLWRTWSPGWGFTDEDFMPVAEAVQNAQFVDTVLHYYRFRWGAVSGAAQHAAAQADVEAMPDIVVPTTHIQGLDDRCTRPETAARWASRITGGYRRVDMPGVGHFPQREAPEQVAAEVLATVRAAEQ